MGLVRGLRVQNEGFVLECWAFGWVREEEGS